MSSGPGNAAALRGMHAGREPRPARARSWFLAVLLTLCIGVVTAVIHWPVLKAQAQCWDDSQYLTQNELVTRPSWASAKRFLIEVLEPSTVSGYYQPLAMISLMLDCAMGGHEGDFTAFHRTSLALHLLNTLLIVLLLYALFGDAWAAAAAGLLFGSHPLTVEPVAWVSDRKTLLATWFALLSLLAYVRYARAGGWAAYAGALLFYLLSLLSKLTSLPLPLVMLLMDHWPLGRLDRRAVANKIPFLLIAGAFALIGTVSQHQTESLSLPAGEAPLHLPLRLTYLIAFYLSKVVMPIRLTSTYRLPEPLALSNGIVLAATALTVLLAALLVFSRRRTSAFWVGAAIFLVLLAPTMGLIGYSWLPASDKYVYLPAVGLLLVLGWLLAWCSAPIRSSRFKAGVAIAIAGLVAVEAVGTRRTLRHWRDSETRFRYMLDLAPNEPRVMLSLGVVLANEGNIDEGIRYIARSLELRADDAYGQNHLAVLLAKRGEFDAAIPHLREAIRCYKQDRRRQADCTTASVNLGNMLLQLGRKDEALVVFRRAAADDPGNLAARVMIAAAMGDAGRLDECIEHLQAVLRIDPQHPQARATLEAVLRLRAPTRPTSP